MSERVQEEEFAVSGHGALRAEEEEKEKEEEEEEEEPVWWHWAAPPVCGRP